MFHHLDHFCDPEFRMTTNFLLSGSWCNQKARLDVQNRTAKKLRLKYFFNLSFFIFV